MAYARIRRRRAEALTNYKKRIALLKGNIPRLVARKTNRNIILQIIDYKVEGDKVIASVNSKELKTIGWSPRSNIPTAYLSGMLLAKKAKSLSISKLVLDMGLARPSKFNVLFAAAKGCLDSGINVISNIEFDENRLSGKHIANYAKGIGKEATQFSRYYKENFDPKQIDLLFEQAKGRIRSD